jgi:hypothetical protein
MPTATRPKPSYDSLAKPVGEGWLWARRITICWSA